jgi:serine/threonine-protein kinase
MILLYVPAGEFTMGSDKGNADEKPVHVVSLNAFFIDQTEVTNAMYAKCVAAGGCSAPRDTSSFTHSNYYGNNKYDDFPVIYVNWTQANSYCEWAGRRLPSEAEWEKSARGTDQRTYPWGEGIDKSRADYSRYVGDPNSVGTYETGKSPYGALDMAGNVWEWVDDWYGEQYYQGSPASNPTGPASGQDRVLRGGSWGNDPNSLRVSTRLGSSPDGWHFIFGFRCARSE